MKLKKKNKVPHFTYEISEQADNNIDSLLEQLNTGKMSSEKVLKEFMEIAEDHPLYPTVFFGIGVVYALGNQYKSAIPYFTKAATLNPYCIEAMFNNALAHAALGDAAGQLILLSDIVMRGSKNDEIVINALAILNEMEIVIKNTHNIDLNSYIKNARRFKFAQEKMSLKKWDAAIPVLESLLKKTPKIPALWNNLALCYANKGKKQLALQHIESALELDANYLPARTNHNFIENNMIEGQSLPGQQIWSVGNNL